MKLIDWPGIKDTRSLIESLILFLKEVFGAKLEDEARKLCDWSRISSESYEYLRQLNVHRAAKWYVLLQKLRENGYSFDLRFSAETEEFQKLLPSAYSLYYRAYCPKCKTWHTIHLSGLPENEHFHLPCGKVVYL